MVYAARYLPVPLSPPNVADVSPVIKALCLADPAIAGEDLIPDRLLFSGFPLDAATIPRALEWQSPRWPQDFEHTIIVHVSERFRALIEEFDPGLHQFVPFDLIDRRNALIAKRYCWQVSNRIESVAFVEQRSAKKLVFDLAKIGDSHFWIDPKMGQRIMMSDEAMAMLNENDVSGFKLEYFG